MRWILTTAVILGALVIFHPARADAGMHFCNKTGKTVSVAMATVDVWSDIAHVWGWWQVPAGGCKTPIGADLDTTGDTGYFYFASDFAGGRWTDSKNYGFCIDPNYAFDYNDAEDTRCVSGAREHFRWIDTGHERDFTMNLTD